MEKQKKRKKKEGSDMEDRWREIIEKEINQLQTLIRSPLTDGQTFRWKFHEKLRLLRDYGQQMSSDYPATDMGKLPLDLLAHVYSFLPSIDQMQSWKVSKREHWLPLQPTKLATSRTFRDLSSAPTSLLGAEIDRSPQVSFHGDSAINAGIVRGNMNSLLTLIRTVSPFLQIDGGGEEKEDKSQNIPFEISLMSQPKGERKKGSLSVERSSFSSTIVSIVYDDSTTFLCMTETDKKCCRVSRFHSSSPFERIDSQEYSLRTLDGTIKYVRFFSGINRLVVFRQNIEEHWVDWVSLFTVTGPSRLATLSVPQSVPPAELLSGEKEQLITRIGSEKLTNSYHVLDFRKGIVRSFETLAPTFTSCFKCPTPSDGLVYCLDMSQKYGLHMHAYDEHGTIKKRWGMRKLPFANFIDGDSSLVNGHVYGDTFYISNSIGKSWSITASSVVETEV